MAAMDHLMANGSFPVPQTVYFVGSSVQVGKVSLVERMGTAHESPSLSSHKIQVTGWRDCLVSSHFSLYDFRFSPRRKV